METVLEVKNLTTRFRMIDRTVTAVDNLSFTLYRNEILAIVGESGSGKSVTNLSVMRLVDPPGETDGSSEIIFDGKNLLALSDREMEKIRGRRISMIFQEPSASFNPLFRIGSQIGEGLRNHLSYSRKEAFEQAKFLMKQVHIADPGLKASDYPFQMSGGMLQRCMIAQALACSPDILIADEPTTALDVTTQAQILGLIKEKKDETGMSVIFITHDLALVEDFCDRIMIMYNGQLMEEGNAKDVISTPRHPYTADLIKSIPRPGMFKSSDTLFTIPGKVPRPGEILSGCRYAPRCSARTAECLSREPELCRNGISAVRCFNAAR